MKAKAAVHLLLCAALLPVAQSFLSDSSTSSNKQPRTCLLLFVGGPAEEPDSDGPAWSRRRLLDEVTRGASSAAIAASAAMSTPVEAARATDDLVFLQSYEDFVKGDGFSYREVTEGKGDKAEKGDRIVFDWSGYTIGYFGRPFQAKGGPQGGAFDKDQDYGRVVLGSGSVVQGLESAFFGMKAGGVRQVIVPFGPNSYPSDDLAHDRVGPKPTTFSGQRALNFVLQNPRVDRTLLFNVKVIRVDKPNGKGGFTRGG